MIGTNWRLRMKGWKWTGLDDVNVPALAVCFLVVATFLVLGVLWSRKAETRKRGILTLSVLLVPAILSAILLGLRILAG
jgi:hypothetical protein